METSEQVDNHSIAYCMLGYYCAYFRHYYPLEFITSFLNNAANEADIRNGTAYANRVGIKITMPKWGVSKSEYFYDKEKHVIAKGLSSIKYMNNEIGEALYLIAHSKKYEKFVDVLIDIDKSSCVDSRQLDILIKIDFFSEFGNQRELLRISELFSGLFKRGAVKQIKRDAIAGSPLEHIVEKYSVGVTKAGNIAKSYTILDVYSIMLEAEESIKASHMQDLSDTIKVRNFADIMGYVGYISNKEEDRRKLYVLDIFPVVRRIDGKQFGYSILTKSIGSGKESRFTVFNRIYEKEPIKKGDIIYCASYETDGQYFKLCKYSKIF